MIDPSGIQPPERTQIVQAIVDSGYDPNDFEEKFLSPRIVTIYHKGSQLSFTFEMKPESYHYFKFHYTLYKPKRPVATPTENWRPMTIAIQSFENWITSQVTPYVKAQQLPDPWEKYKNTFFNSDDIPFTEIETNRIKETLETTFRNKVIEQFKLSKSQVKMLDEKIDRLINNVEKLSKRDWMLFAYGVLGNIATTLAFDHSQGIALYNSFVEAFTILKPFLSTGI